MNFPGKKKLERLLLTETMSLLVVFPESYPKTNAAGVLNWIRNQKGCKGIQIVSLM